MQDLPNKFKVMVWILLSCVCILILTSCISLDWNPLSIFDPQTYQEKESQIKQNHDVQDNQKALNKDQPESEKSGEKGSKNTTDKKTEQSQDPLSISSGTLLWQKCSIGQNPHTCSGKTRSLDWFNARQYCAKLVDGPKKWRLPTLKELQQLYEEEKNTKNSQLFVVFDDYWTSDIWMDSNNASVTLNFKTGKAYGELQWNNAFVRCVLAQ